MMVLAAITITGVRPLVALGSDNSGVDGYNDNDNDSGGKKEKNIRE